MRRALAVILVLALAGCTGGDEGDDFQPPPVVQTIQPMDPGDDPVPTTAAAPTPSPVGTRALSVRDLAWGDLAEIHDPGRVVFTDQGTWATFWASATGRAGGEPQVDFARESVLFVLHGPAPNGCYSIRVTGASLTGEEVRANVTTYTNDPSRVCTDNVIYPWQAAAIDHPEARVVFDERTEARAPEASP